MRTLATVLAAATLLWSCGGNQDQTGSETKEETPEAVQQPEVDPLQETIVAGRALVAGSDCTACHHSVNKIIGPSHTQVAEKYAFTEENVKLLAQKIIEGGSGTWGEVPMSPHPNLSQEDAEKMAIYVLSLDGETKK